jgi:hypothetical protein
VEKKMIVDLGAYLPNLARSPSHDLVTASEERLAFRWAGGFWAHQYDCFLDWWQYVDHPQVGHYLFYFFGDYDCPGSHDIWGETPAIQTVPRFWDDAVPFQAAVQYIGTQIRRSGTRWTLVQTQDFTTTTRVQRVPGDAGTVIRVTMEEQSASSLFRYTYDLADGIPVIGGAPDRGVKRFQVHADGALSKDMTLVAWVPR